jgi:hypothetical protein
VWAHIGKLPAYHVMLTYAARPNYSGPLLDAKCAFLNGDVNETLYFRPALGVDVSTIWILHKALFGLKQAAHAWHRKFFDKDFAQQVGPLPQVDLVTLFAKIEQL